MFTKAKTPKLSSTPYAAEKDSSFPRKPAYISESFISSNSENFTPLHPLLTPSALHIRQCRSHWGSQYSVTISGITATYSEIPYCYAWGNSYACGFHYSTDTHMHKMGAVLALVDLEWVDELVLELVEVAVLWCLLVGLELREAHFYAFSTIFAVHSSPGTVARFLFPGLASESSL